MSQGVECYSCLPKTAWPPTSKTYQLEPVPPALVASRSLLGCGYPVNVFSPLFIELLLEVIERTARNACLVGMRDAQS